MTARTIIYGRVSSDQQAASGLGLQAQQTRLDVYCHHQGLEPTLWLCDDGVSGSVAPDARPGLCRALELLASGDADTLVVPALSRLGRSLRDVLDVFDRAKDQGWRLIILDISADTDSPFGKAMLGFMAIVSELERDLAAERTRDALAAAKARGVRLGAPASDAVRDAGRRAQALRAEGRSWSAVAAALEAEGYVTGRGKTTWSKMQASRAARTVELDDEAAANAQAHAGDTDND